MRQNKTTHILAMFCMAFCQILCRSELKNRFFEAGEDNNFVQVVISAAFYEGFLAYFR
jgi:hypothetical protein